MTTYKFRAECIQDVDLFTILIGELATNLKTEMDFPELDWAADVVVTFDSELPIEEIIIIMNGVDDGHVLYQTVQPIEKYTGARDYSL